MSVSGEGERSSLGEEGLSAAAAAPRPGSQEAFSAGGAATDPFPSDTDGDDSVEAESMSSSRASADEGNGDTQQQQPPPPPPRQSLPWWKRILVDRDYRSTLTTLATVCYRQELHVLDAHPSLLSSHGNATVAASPSTARAKGEGSVATATALTTETTTTHSRSLPPRQNAFPPRHTLAQFACVPSAPAGSVKVWDANSREWRDTCLPAIRHQTRPWPAAAHADDGEDGFFSTRHPKSMAKHSGLASRQRAQLGQAVARPDEEAMYCSAEALRDMRPDSPRSAKQRQADSFERCYGGGLDGVRRLRAVLDTMAYKAYYGEGYYTEMLAAQRESLHRQWQQQQQALGKPRRATPPSPTAPPHGLPALPQALAQRARASGATEERGWSHPPRTAEEIDVDNVLGLSYFWDKALPPSGFIRLAPDPRRAMWSDTFAEDEAARRQLCPRLRQQPTTPELLQEPRGFTKAIVDHFDTPLCIHIFRQRPAEEKRTRTKESAAAVVKEKGRGPPREAPDSSSGRGAARAVGKACAAAAASPTATGAYDYLGTFRQSLLLIHAKVYFRALHEEQRMRLVGAMAHVGGCNPQQQPQPQQQQQQRDTTAADERPKKRTPERPSGRTRGRHAGGHLSLQDAGHPGNQGGLVEATGAEPSDKVKAMEASTAEEALSTAPASAAGEEGRESGDPVSPTLLHGVPEVPFPVLKVSPQQAWRHNPVPFTTSYSIDKIAAAALARVSSSGSGGGSGPARGERRRKAKCPARTAASAGVVVAANKASSGALPQGMWMGLTATPDLQPPAATLAATRVWRQLHHHSRAARSAVKDVFLCLPRDAEGCLGKDAYMRFVLDLLGLFFPTHLSSSSSSLARRGGEATNSRGATKGTNDNSNSDGDGDSCRCSTVHEDIAEEEWAYRGCTENVSFPTFFEKFFSFPFIFLRDLSVVTEREYVGFWELVKLALYKDSAAMVAALIGRMEDQTRNSGTLTVGSSEEPSATDDQCGGGTEEVKLLLLLLAHLREPKATSTIASPSLTGTVASDDGGTPSSHQQQQHQQQQPPLSRDPSVLYQQRLSHDLWPSAILPPFAEFTTSQLYTLCMTDYSHAPRHGRDCPQAVLLTPRNETHGGGEEARCQPLMGKEANTITAAAAYAVAVAGPSATKGTPVTTPFPSATGEALDPAALAHLLRDSVHYQRRHQKNKAERLHNIASHQAVASTWEVYGEEVYDVTEGFHDGAHDVATHTAPLPAAESALSMPIPRADGELSFEECRHDKPKEAAEAEMDRLLRFLADIPDEVFTDGQVSVRERFDTHEAFQRARLGRTLR